MKKTKTKTKTNKTSLARAYKAPEIMQGMDSHLGDCGRFAPSLLAARASLLPFIDVIGGWCAGPQPTADDADAEPYFTFDVDDPSQRNGETWVRVTESKVTLIVVSRTGEGEEVFAQEIETTLQGLWDYLRQIPRDAGSYFSVRQQT